MKIASLLACLALSCTASVTLHAQALKPELRPLDFNKLDTNHDGKLSRLEARVDPGLDMDFDALDVNHDNYLSIQEFEAWPRAKKTQTAERTTVPSGSGNAQHMTKPPQ